MNPKIKSRDYRSDIDGLRAIAIISVIFYHIDPTILPGGFTGVDIFFVISGFLISSHLLYEITIKREFSFKVFYVKRVRRILPALLVMIFLVNAIGYFIFTNFYFHSLGEQALSAVLSYSNIYFYLTSGYFDLDSSLLPLLHTWSLGVEEQFYILWPAILVSILVFIKDYRKILPIFILFFIASFLFNKIYLDDPGAIFYLMPFRIFEFSVGAIVACLLLNKNEEPLESGGIFANVLAVIGVLLVIFPMFFLNDQSVFPYYNVLPTVFGSALLIFFRCSLVSKVLSFRLFVFIGLISYSLYLYHWPVIVFIKYHYKSLAINEFYFIVIFISFFLAVSSYYLVERPFRYSKKPLIYIMFFILITTVFIFSLTGAKLNLYGSFRSEDELIKKTIEDVVHERHSLILQDGCRIEAANDDKNCSWKAEKQILFFGNSHNLDGYNIFRLFFNDNKKYNLIFSGNSYLCKYELQQDGRVSSKNNKCVSGAEKLSSLKFISKIDVLVVNIFKIQTWGAGLLPIIEEMRKLNPNLKIVVIGGFIGLRPSNCRELVNKSGNLDICKSEEYVTYWGAEESQRVLSNDFTTHDFLYIDRIDLLCGKKRLLKNCVTRIGKDLFFYDGDHFSLFGSRYLSELIFDKYKSQLYKMGIEY